MFCVTPSATLRNLWLASLSSSGITTISKNEARTEALRTRIKLDEAVIAAETGKAHDDEQALRLDRIRFHLVRDRYRLQQAQSGKP